MPVMATALAGVGVPAGSEPPAASADGFGAAEAAVELLAPSPYPFGETRAVLIEDLDGMALELIEGGS